ncbi:MAG: YciI family protein [Opitutus sp.]
MPTPLSPFLLLFRNSIPDAYKSMSPEQHQHVLMKWNDWYDRLIAEGKLQYGHPLEPDGRIVEHSRGDRVVDGPFAETKEAIGGYFFILATNLAEATEVARGCPGLAHGMVVEVRAIADCCHLGRVGAGRDNRSVASVT